MVPLPSIPPRDPRGHKGTFGTVCVVGGQCAGGRVMVGGPALTAEAALRAGAGLAVLAVPEPIIAAALSIAPSATGIALPVDEGGRILASRAAELLDAHAGAARCFAVGPGFGADGPQQQIVARLIARDGAPLVIDADAINALAAGALHGELAAPVILTPHPGEFDRIASSLGLAEDPRSPARRSSAAEALARRLGCVVVLKGHETVVTDGITTSVNASGSAALATAGTGDVLTGIIAGLVAQFHRDAGPAAPLGLLDCARLGVHLHGLAADRWTQGHGDRGLLAGDLLREIPAAIRDLARIGDR